MRGLHEGGARQLLDLRLWQRRFRPIDARQIPMHREAGGLELVTQTANLAIGELGLDPEGLAGAFSRLLADQPEFQRTLPEAPRARYQ